MKYQNYKEFEKAYSALYVESEYEEVLDLLQKADEVLSNEEYENNEFTVILDTARVYSELKKDQECLDSIEEAMKKGFSFPLDWKRFDFLREDIRYKDIKKRNDILLKKDREVSELKYEVHLPKSYNKSNKFPLVFILHGDGADGNIEDIKWYWKPNSLVEQGFIVVYPQSTQVYCHNGFGWLLEPILSRKLIKDCYEKVKAEYAIDENCIILSGFSGGANTVVDLIMGDVIPTRGFIGLCPGETVKSFRKEAAEKAAKKGIRGVIMEGEYEMEPPVQDMLKELEEVGFSCEYYINKEIGHWYPNDIDEKVNTAIKFLLD